jgi:hypothetical protein
MIGDRPAYHRRSVAAVVRWILTRCDSGMLADAYIEIGWKLVPRVGQPALR